MGKPAATDRPCLRSLSHSFTLDWVVLCNGTKAQAHAMKEELGGFLSIMGLKLSEEKTKVTHITEGFTFLGYRITRSIGGSGKMVPKVEIPQEAIKKFRYKISGMLAPNTHNHSTSAKIQALNRVIRGWCQYYRATSGPARDFGKIEHEVFWKMAHWIGRKYKVSIPVVMRRYNGESTLQTTSTKLLRATKFKAKRLRTKT